MLGGFGFMSGQVVALVLVAVVLGVVLGRYAWPRRPYRRDTPSASSVVPGWQVSGTAAPQDSLQARGEDTQPPVALIADAQARAAHAEARVDQARSLATELEARLSESQSALKETWHQLKQTEAELIRMQRQVQELEDRKEAEIGRLESGAIAALESTIATHREQVAKLEEKLRAAEGTAQDHVRELAIERRRSAQLQSALAGRDQHIATLASEQA